MVTSRFGVRPDGAEGCFEVFDRRTNVPVATGLRRSEAEAEARARNGDTSGPTALRLHLAPVEVCALREAVQAHLETSDEHQTTLSHLLQLLTWEPR